MESLQVAIAKARLSPKPQPVSAPAATPLPASGQAAADVPATDGTGGELRQIKDKLDALERLFLQLSQSLAAAATLRQDDRTRAPSILDIKHAICRRYGVTMGEIDSPQHDAKLVRPRHIAMYLAHRLTLKSLPEIGRGFGGRDHTTILNAKKKIAKLRAEDRDFAQELAELERSLAGPPK
jgi:chromosomal replication initiation ATPase DnaA